MALVAGELAAKALAKKSAEKASEKAAEESTTAETESSTATKKNDKESGKKAKPKPERKPSPGERGGTIPLPKVRKPTGDVWTVFIIAGLIALMAIVTTGGLAEGVFLALLVFVLVGAILPPVGIVVGLIILVAMMFRGNAGGRFFAWLGGLTGRTSTPSQPYAPIAPTLPGYAPPTSSNPYAPLGPSAQAPNTTYKPG